MADKERQAGNVRQLPPSGLAVTNEGVADELRRLAARIESGELGEVVNTVTVVNGNPQFGCVSAGMPITRVGVVGLLTIAIHRACWNEGAYLEELGEGW